MKLIWLHGAPAVGKLTVAKELARKYNYKLFHNHLVIDLSLSIYDNFGDKDFYDFNDQIRRTVISKAKEIDVSHLVMTYMTCYDSERGAINKYLEFFSENRIEVYPVHLNPSHDIIRERSQSNERVSSNKLSCQDTISKLLRDVKFAGIKHENSLSIDNSDINASEVAHKIAMHVG